MKEEIGLRFRLPSGEDTELEVRFPKNYSAEKKVQALDFLLNKTIGESSLVTQPKLTFDEFMAVLRVSCERTGWRNYPNPDIERIHEWRNWADSVGLVDPTLAGLKNVSKLWVRTHKENA